jgi:hypothetical protein
VTVVAAVDLDRTLVYSPSALLLDEAEPEVRRLVCVELYRGRPLSFVTEAAAAGIAELNERGVLVPVTTRTVEQYQRIALPGRAPALALCANGGRLLRDGVEDLDFTAAVRARLAGAGAPLAELHAELVRVSEPGSGRPFVEQVREASGLFCYAVVEREGLPTGWIEGLTAFAAERSWGVSVQGRKVYLVPTALTKAAAAREVADLLGADLLLAAGDSLLDADLLEVADAAIRPAHGELDAAGWLRDHVEVTTTAGVLAGAEIVAWLLARTLP